MKKYLPIMVGLMLVFLILFGIVEALQIPLLTDPTTTFDHAGSEIALLSVTLLILDVLIPVPSSLIMIANGALFGIVVGTLLSVVGSMGSAALGFGLGRRGSPRLARLITEADQQQAEVFLAKWGVVAIIASRPIPILAETVAVIAGTTRLRWSTMLVASCAGTLPSALLYAITGATALQLDSFLLTFALVLGVALVFWAIGYVRMNKRQPV